MFAIEGILNLWSTADLIYFDLNMSTEVPVRTYFQSDVQAICLARMFHCLVLVSPYSVVSVMVSPDAAPNSTYTDTVYTVIRL